MPNPHHGMEPPAKAGNPIVSKTKTLPTPSLRAFPWKKPGGRRRTIFKTAGTRVKTRMVEDS